MFLWLFCTLSIERSIGLMCLLQRQMAGGIVRGRPGSGFSETEKGLPTSRLRLLEGKGPSASSWRRNLGLGERV